MADKTERYGRLERLQRWIDMPIDDLRQALCMRTDGSKADARRETQGMTRGEIIVRWVEENGMGTDDE